MKGDQSRSDAFKKDVKKDIRHKRDIRQTNTSRNEEKRRKRRKTLRKTRPRMDPYELREPNAGSGTSVP